MLLVDRIDEPAVDIFEEGQSLVVLAELPGARLEDVEVRVNGDVLVLSTRPGHHDRRRYYREMLLPFAVHSEGLQRTFRNGVLELELERANKP
jgi:HSP20 family protein